MNEAQLIKALNRAQELMNDSSFNSLVESKSRNVNFDNSGNIIMNKRENLSHEELVNEFSSNRTKGLPVEILESFNKQPSPEVSSSRIDNATNYLLQNKKIQNINENKEYYNTHQTNNIDYSLIKTIVNECISSQLSSIKENILNENIIKGFTLKEGNKIQFISKNGNLYEGELKLKKKKNK